MGAAPTFSVFAIGVTPMFYQWRFNGTNIANGGAIFGATTADLTISSAQTNHTGSYSVVVTNSHGSVTSSVAVLTVLSPVPAITSQPADRTNVTGTTATFAVSATGTSPLAYQWRKDGTKLANGGNVSGSLTNVLTLSTVTTNDAADYTVVVTNSYGSVTSQVGRLLVLVQPTLADALETPGLVWTSGGSAPWFPQAATTHDGLDAAQSGLITHSQESWVQTSLTGLGTLTYWWAVSSESSYDYLEFYLDGVLQSGRISGSVAWQQQTFTIAAGAHTVKWRYVKDGSVNSGQDAGWVDQVLFIPDAPAGPVITQQPQSRTNSIGSTATFTVVATGSAPLAYQWRFNGTNMANGGSISGVDTTNLTVASVQMNHAGNYSVVVTNAYGVAKSSVAVLTVLPTVPAITSQPVSRTNFVDTTATFTVTATGTAPLAYQWRLNGTNLVNGGNVFGAATTNLTLAPVKSADAGGYSVVINDAYGSVTSAIAMLTVWLPPQLQITRSGPQVLLSWPTSGPTFVVETSSNLSAVTVWRVVTNTVTISGNRFWVTNQPASNPAFYRLRQQASSPATAGMVLIPAGPFTMGNTFPGEGYSDELPLHTNQVSAFYMDQCEVTKALWDEVLAWANTHGYDLGTIGLGKATNHPVHTVSWYDVVKWCNARSEKAGLVPAYYTSAAQTKPYRTGQTDVQNDWVKWNTGYRLPTEAEWEKAARGGASGQRFPWAGTNNITHSQANYYSDSSDAYDTSPTRGYHPSFQAGGMPYTSPVGYFAPNGYGLYDMTGNLWEWTWDWSGSYTAAATDPRGPTSGSYRLLRGGSWINGAFGCRAALRIGSYPTHRDIYDGFRSVLPPGQP